MPLRYALAEFDGLWHASQERVDGFANCFAYAPFVDASLFADRCAIEAHRPLASGAKG